MGIDNARWSRDPSPFICRGLNLSLPVDKLPVGKYRALDNVRPYGEGQIIGRPGLALDSLDSAGSPIHSIKLINDPIADPVQFPAAFNPFCLYIGDGTELRRGIPTAPGGPVSLNHLVDSGFSGNPLGMVVAKPSFSTRPWIYIADSLKMREQSSAFQAPQQWGTSPPNDPPTAALGAADANGPDTGGVGIPYVYRYRGRKAQDTQPGDYGNAGPSMRLVDATGAYAGINAMGQDIVVTIVVAHPDPSVELLDIFRFGGSLPQWTYVGSVTNVAGVTFTDTYNDAAIANNPILEEDNFQPFPSLDQPVTGTATVTAQPQGGAIVDITSGGQFLFYDPANLDQPYYGFGNQIIVHGQAFTMYRAPTSATQVEVVENPNATVVGAGKGFTLPSPQIWHQPLPFIWGPFGSGFTGIFIFGCGDNNDLGALKWTKGNRAESAPDINRLEITSPSEPLQNGCMYGGTSWVFSSERLFQVYPNFGGATDFLAIEVPNSKGLFMRWAVCVGRKGIYFRARDGIYRTTGGVPQSITDLDLFSLFPHESPTSSFVVDGQDATPGGVGGAYSPPDDTQEAAQRISAADGFINYTYLGQDGKRRTLIFNEETDAWISRDTYTPEILFHYQEEGGDDYSNALPIHNVQLCGADGNLYTYSATAFSDSGSPIAGHVRTPSHDQKDARAHKKYGDVFIDYESECEALNAVLGFHDFTQFSIVTPVGANLTGRRDSVIDINGGLGQYADNIGLDISWNATQGRPALFFWEPSFIPKPELSVLRATDWTDDGHPAAKFFQGFYIEGDSLGLPRTFDIQFDGGAVGQAGMTFSVSNQQEIVYSFTTPFISRLVRLVPKDSNFWRLFKIRWIWEPAPDLALNWITQGTTHDFANFFHHRDARIALVSTDIVTLTITRLDDSSNLGYSIPSTGGIHRKQYLVLSPEKAKIVSYSLTSPTPFRLFVKDTSVRVGEWGRGDAYKVVMPFGDVSRERGAII